MRDIKEQEVSKISGSTQMAGLVDYQVDAIVSRTLIDKNAGTITVFAFAEGQKLSEHTAPFDAMVHIMDGNCEVTISGKAHQLKAGDMIIMPANKPHGIKATKNFKMLLIMIRS